MLQGLTNLISVLAGGFRWWVAPAQRACLLGPKGLRLQEWLRAGQARVVKEGPHRIVYRVELPGQVFFLKHNLLPDLRSWFRQLIRPSKARMEFQRALAVASRGLPTIVPLALGERKSLLGVGESYLITQSLEDTQPLNVFLNAAQRTLTPEQQTRTRQTLARELGQLLGRIHQAGILHNDLHTGNILLRDKGPAGYALFLIDLNAVHLSSPLDWKTTRTNLAMLNRGFVFPATRSDRLRFWRAYCQARAQAGWKQGPGDPGTAKSLACELEEHTLDSVQDFCKRFDRRCLKTNRYFRKISGPGMVGHTASDLDPAAWANLLSDPDEPFRRAGARLLKDSASSTVTEFEVRVAGQVRRVVYKRFRVTSLADPLAALFRPSPAHRSWVFAQALLKHSLPTPRPLLLLQRRRAGLYWEGYLLTEKIENAQDLHQFLESLDRLGAADRRQRLQTRIDQVARVLRELHRRRFANRDPKASNWLLSPLQRRDGFRPDFAGVWIIDLVGISQHRRLPREKRLKNLARLNASFQESPHLTRTDRLRFLRIYLQWSLKGKEGWKKWWRNIDAATQAKVARNIRHNRVLK